MKRIFLVAGLLLAGYTASAQVYVSVTGGYAWGVPSTKIGEESINGKESVRFGTFGEGINSQLRVGYFFNKTWGIDVSAGYLYGEDQLVKREVRNTSYCYYRWRSKGTWSRFWCCPISDLQLYRQLLRTFWISYQSRRKN